MQIALVMKQLAAGWRFGGYGYVEMWVLEEKWKEEEEEERRAALRHAVRGQMQFSRQRPLSCLNGFSCSKGETKAGSKAVSQNSVRHKQWK